MPYSLDPISDNCYPGTSVLINKLDIRNEQELSEVEAYVTFTKASQLEGQPVVGALNFEHYRGIHKYLFEDLYDWAVNG